MKNRLFLLLLLAMTFVHASIVVDPNCTINVGASDVYISGGFQIDLVKDVPKYPTINFDPSSRLYFVGDGDADLTNVYILHNATVDKPSGDLYLNTNMTVTGNLDFSSGNIITGAHTVSLDQVLNGNLSGESATSYVVGTVVASRAIGTGTSTFGNIGFAITNTGSNLGIATVTREAGSGSDINIYGSNGIQRKWTLGTSIGFTGTRNVTSSWLSNEDNGNTLADLKVWKYEASKSNNSVNDAVSRKKILNKSSSKVATSSDRDIRELSAEIDDDGPFPPVPENPRTLGWVEVDGASFNTASSPRTSTFSIDAATIFTINDALNAFADGSGTESNPYQIETLSQLDNVRNYLSACFKQIADIDAIATSGWNAGAGWIPIISFAGHYDGQGYTISNLFINRPGESYTALFGSTNAGSLIEDLGLENVDVTGLQYSGTLVGRNYGDVQYCYSKGVFDTADGYRSGGFVGYTYSGSSINNCYAYVDVTRSAGTNTIDNGAFCGRNFGGNIANCYSTGSVSYTGTTDPTDKGFVGSFTGTFANNFWNIDLSAQSTATGATGLTTNEMRTLSTFTDATWDFQDESANGAADIWGMNYAENNAFPFLSWQGITHDPISGFAGGMGTESEPFLISTPVELDNVRNFIGAGNEDKYFLQTADLDLSGYQAGEGWEPIGNGLTVNFRGSYDGAGHKISNLLINKPAIDYIGLFGCSYSGSTIENIGIENADVEGDTYVGGLLGRHYGGDISNCYVNGNVNGISYVGGITGYMASPGTITNCYSHAIITRTSGTSTGVGAFCGRNYNGTITKSYSTGSVHYTGYTDPTDKGFLGTTGVATMSDNFWDTEASGQLTSVGGVTGKTTAEMQDVATYTAIATVGLTTPWDFVGDPNDDVATDDIWNMHISLNGGYPYFEYENRTPVLAPQNLALVYSGGDVTLTWDAVSGATGYAVYSSDDPYGTFILDGSGAFNGEEWTITTADPKMFYFVTATNATKETPKVIKMNNPVVSK